MVTCDNWGAWTESNQTFYVNPITAVVPTILPPSGPQYQTINIEMFSVQVWEFSLFRNFHEISSLALQLDIQQMEVIPLQLLPFILLPSFSHL